MKKLVTFTLPYILRFLKTRKNAIAEYQAFQIPVTQLKGSKEDGDMQADKIDCKVGGRQTYPLWAVEWAWQTFFESIDRY